MSRKPRGPSRFRSKLCLAFFGIALGACLAVLTVQLPDSTPMTRVEALWQPAFKDLRRGAASLKENDTGTAASYFDRALSESAGRKNEQTVLDLVVDNCGRYRAWDLAKRYAWKALEHRQASLDKLRYGEALLGAGQPAQAQIWFQQILDAPVSNTSRSAISAQAEHDLAYALAAQQKDLEFARELAENGIQKAMRRPGSQDMLAALNDVLAWTYLIEAGRRPAPGKLELARIYGENAVESLAPDADPSISADAFYHLSEIYTAEGMDAAARDSFQAAWRASPATVEWLTKVGHHPMK